MILSGAWRADKKRILLEENLFLQVAALIYTVENGILKFYLITSRRTKRWIIPKGWPVPHKTLAYAALNEAYEEAGIHGRLQAEPIGYYHYQKKRILKKTRNLKVYVFPLQYAYQEEQWPEKKERIGRWCSRQEASAAVQEEELKLLINNFTPHPFL